MSDALSIASNGISQAVARATQSVSNIVNSSSTGKNSDGDLINLDVTSTDVAANALALKKIQKAEDSLLDIKV